MKAIKSILLSAATLTLFAGCAKTEIKDIDVPENDGLVFTATIASTKTVLDASTGKVAWTDGDVITVNGVEYVATPDDADASKATFNKKNTSDADPVAVDGMYYASYACTFDTSDMSGILPAVQEYDSSDISAVAPMFASSTSTELSFNNICTLLEITLKGTETIKSIEVSASNIGMSGQFVVSDDGSEAMIIDDNKAGVKLLCDDEALTESGVAFYIAVPAYDYEGLTIKATDSADEVWEIKSKKTASMEANTIYSLAFTPVFVQDVLLKGVFSVSDSKKVNFFKSNLILDGGKYSFASSQTATGSLFASTSELPSQIGGHSWCILTPDEWEYLLINNRSGFLTVEGQYGVVILPDNSTVKVSTATWAELEAADAIFLPAAGYAYGDSAVCGVNEGGSYWAGDKSFDFDVCEIYPENEVPASIKESVRLASVVTSK